MESNDIELEYVGFWARVGASIIDTLLISLIILPIVTAVYGCLLYTSPSPRD